LDPIHKQRHGGLGEQAGFATKRAIVELLVDRVIVDGQGVDVRYVMPLKGLAQRKGVLRPHHRARPPTPQGADAEHARLPTNRKIECARVVCDGQGFMRNLRDGFYRMGEPSGDPRLPHVPRLVRVWDDITRLLAAA